VEKKQLIPFLEKYGSMNSRYPRRRLDFNYDPSKIDAHVSAGYFLDPQSAPMH
jgi:hypothetical protein